MYSTTDFRRGLKIEIDGAPYEIIEFQHFKPGKGGAKVRTKLRNLRVAQIAALLWSLSAFCTRDSTIERHAMRFARLRESFEANRERFGNDDDANAFVSYFEFIWKLVDIWVSQRV